MLSKVKSGMDHDALFKELIGTLFLDFIDLFFPNISAQIDRSSEIIRMNQEIFTDITKRKKHIVDLVMRVKVKDQETFFLIHIENQAKRDPDFSWRMFNYYSRLLQEYRLPIYPIAVFSYDQPFDREATKFGVAFPDLNALRFEFKAIQLNHLPWRRFINKDNPVACALMAKMRIAEKDRPRVKLECLRMLAKMQLDPARTTLVGTFIESYLRLSPDETARFSRDFARLEESEKEATMELMTSWERKGLEQGLAAGTERIVLRLLRHRFGELPSPVLSQIDRLNVDQLGDLSEALLDFNSASDLDQWLAAH